MTGLPAPAQAQQIIERLSGQFSGRDAPTQVVYGAVPAALPANLAAPIDVLVSFRMVHGNTVLHRTGTPRPPRPCRSWARSLLPPGGRPRTPTPAGFVSPQTEQYRKFDDVNPAGKGEEYAANLTVVTCRNRTNLDLNVSTAPVSQTEGMKRAATSAPRSSLPSLRALPNAKLNVRYASGGPNALLSTAYVTGTPLSANEVLSHYSAQLKAAGWKAVTDSTTGPLRVITCALKDVNGREAIGIRPGEGTGRPDSQPAGLQALKHLLMPQSLQGLA